MKLVPKTAMNLAEPKALNWACRKAGTKVETLVVGMAEMKAEPWVEASAAQMVSKRAACWACLLAARSVRQMAERTAGTKVASLADSWGAKLAAHLALQRVL